MDDARRRGLFDRAVAYWNARRFHEAHEDWEDLWNEEEGQKRLWLQGLIQYAAAFYHYERGFFASGFARLMRTASEKVRDYDGDTEGMRWDLLQRDLAPWIEHAERIRDDADLRAGAPGPPPAIRHVEGHEPHPLPLEPEET